MEYKNILSFNVKWNVKTVSLFIFLLILPNLLGMINLPVAAGFKIHFFQFAVFMAALIYGPTGGLLSGLVGSFQSAIVMNNPYIIGGNMILGFFAGFFIRHGFKALYAVLLAYGLQLPWLIFTDYFLVHLPLVVIWKLVIALAVSNIIWAVLAHHTTKGVKDLLA